MARKPRSWYEKKKTKKFDGKNYVRAGISDTKTDAKGKVKGYHERGYNARITKDAIHGKPGMIHGNPRATSSTIYQVWVRKRR